MPPPISARGRDGVVRRPERALRGRGRSCARPQTLGDPGHLERLVAARAAAAARAAGAPPGSCRRRAGPTSAGCDRPRRRSRARRRSTGWPRRSARSGQLGGRSAPAAGAGAAARSAPSPSPAAGRDCSSGEHLEASRPAPPRAASPGQPRSPACPSARGRLGHRQRARRPGGSSRPARARRPARAARARRAAAGRRRPSSAAAIARSNPGPALGRSAGARLAVIRCCGNLNPELTRARAHPLPRLPDRGVREPDDREARQPAARRPSRRGPARPRPRSGRRCERWRACGDRRSDRRAWRAKRRRLVHALVATERARRRRTRPSAARA